MNNEDFKVVVDGCVDNIKQVLESKSQEYSSKEDKLHNFVAAAKLMRCKTKEYALLGMLNKHLVSVIDMIVKYEQEGILPSAKLVNEKIGDSINYFVLLKACFMEDIYNEENKETEKAGKEFAKAIRENPDKWIKMRKEIEQFEAQKPMDINEVWKQQQAAMANSNNDKQDVETLKKEQALVANSLWNNARKRLVVEKLRKMLKPMFVYLTDNNRFMDYEKIKGILNRAELERDSVPDDFIEDVICVMEKLVFPSNGYQIREELVTSIIQAMMQPKYKCGEIVWYLDKGLNGIWKMGGGMTIAQFGLFLDVKHAIYCKSIFNEIIHEKDCFKTEEEAEKECERRNKEIEKGSVKE